jgi:hypothetical protein
LSIMLNTYTASSVTFRAVDAMQRAIAHGIEFAWLNIENSVLDLVKTKLYGA